MNKLNKPQSQTKYWFYLDNYVYVVWKKDSALLYNPLTGHMQEYIAEPEIVKLLKRLHHPRNLLVIPLSSKDMENPALARLVQDARRHFMGDIVEQRRSNGRPVQMQPILKVRRDADKMKREATRSVGEEMMKYINELNLYLTNSCPQSCAMCDSAYRQFLCCAKHPNPNIQQHLSPIHIEYVLDHLSRGNLDTINFLGGNPLDYNHWRQLNVLLDGREIKKVLICHYKNLTARAKDLKTIFDQTWRLEVLVDFSQNDGVFLQTAYKIQEMRVPYSVHFIVKSEAEFERAGALSEKLNHTEIQYHPFYDGTNEDFFRKGVFIDRQTLGNSRPTNRDIYARRAVNPLHFGNLTIFANGHVHANVNAGRLGILGRDSLYDMVFKEMHRGTSWRRTRLKVAPCRECLYNALCPPLSNYEYTFGRNNLCDIYEAYP